MDVRLNHKDIQLTRRLRECLQNRTVDVGSLDELLTSLEGKITPPVEGRKRRTVKQPARVVHHLDRITNKTKRA